MATSKGLAIWIEVIKVLGAIIVALISFAAGLYVERGRGPVGPAPAMALPLEHEWQWTGENWYGRVLLAGQGPDLVVKMARVFELKKVYSDPKTPDMVFGATPVLESLNGSLKLRPGGGAEIDLLVNKSTTGHPGYVAHQITGPLSPVTCLAGKVSYRNTVTNEWSKGDMVLVNHFSVSDDLTRGRFDPNRHYTPR